MTVLVPSRAPAEPSRRQAHATTFTLMLCVAAAIALFVPQDIALGILDTGSRTLAAAIIVAAGLIGRRLAEMAGMPLALAAPRSAVVAVALSACVALGVLATDALGMALGLMSESARAYLTNEPLPQRLVGFMMRAFTENMMYRLFLTSLFACALGKFWTRADGRPQPRAIVCAIVLAQVVNIALNVVLPSDAPVTLAALAYDGVRYVVPGAIWGWLFWRHGFAATEIASTGVHVFLQPPLGLIAQLM